MSREIVSRKQTDPVDFFHRVEILYPRGKRRLRCGCGVLTKGTIVRHVKQRHPDIWEATRRGFYELFGQGLTYRSIMAAFTRQRGQYIFSWTVVKKETKRFAEEQGLVLPVHPASQVRSWSPPKPDSQWRPKTTVWDFPNRGEWAVHRPDYEGNWSPYLVRELILSYSSKASDIVLDPFSGGGTSLIEAVLLRRAAIGVDVSPHAVAHSSQRLKELREAAKITIDHTVEPESLLRVGQLKADSRYLPLADDTIDLILAHPPYGPAIAYTATVEADLSRLSDLEKFLEAVLLVARESLRVLKPGHRCAVLIGDFRAKGRVVPLGWRVFQAFTDGAGFLPEECVIKKQHQDSSTQFYYDKSGSLRYRIAHEYLFVFVKPARRRAMEPG